MALCVTLQPDGTLVPTGQPIEECTGYVLVSGSEHAIYAVVAQAFDIPDPDVAAGWFVGALGAVMFWFVAGRIAGTVAAMFK